VTTLAKLMRKHDLGSIDSQIDVEGAEAMLLFSGDWKRFRPK